MSEEPIAVGTAAMKVVSRIARIFLWLLLLVLLLLFLLMFIGRFFVVAEAPFRFLIGWAIHTVGIFPPLLGSWRKLIPPLGCLILAGFMIHRFVRWSLKAQGNPLNWRPAHTAAAVGMILLGCAAAIAMSGIIHQLVWLSKDPWTEDRGKRIHMTLAVSNARQLGLALLDFHESKGHYPDSLQELEAIHPMIQTLAWVETSRGSVEEPFILLHPGGTMSLDGIEPMIVSPVIGTAGKIVVGYSDNSVMSLPANQLEIILQGGGLRPSPIE